MPSAALRPSSSIVLAAGELGEDRPAARATGRAASPWRGGVDRPPHRSRRARQVEVADAEVAERVDHRVLHRRRGADRAGLADALGAERVERRRRLGAVRPRTIGNSAAVGMRVVGEVAGERVAVVVEARPARTAPGRSPAATPPCCWPSTSSGLSTVPQSSTATWRSSVDLAGLACRPRRRRCARRTGTSRRPGRSRAGRRARACRRRGRSRRPARRPRRRSSPQSSAEAGTPATPTVPASASTTMSSTSASSRWAARLLGLVDHRVGGAEHRRAAELQRARPAGAAAASGQVGVATARSGCARSGCRVRSTTIMANAVWWPWPCADVPALTVADAVGVDLDRAVLARPRRRR